MSYDYTDSSVFNLIGGTHFPVEITAPGPQPPSPPNLSLVCAKCYNIWPCITITDYRAYALAHSIVIEANQSPLQAGFQNQGKVVPPRAT